jgi:Kef-type K+ transport system membrane component KefB
MGTTEIFLIAMLIVFTVPYLIWRIGRTDYYAPLVVVQIIVGILLGPGVLGHFFPAYYDYVFNPQVIAALNGITWWAVMIYVFIAGIELDVTQAWARRRETGITAGLALFVPLALGSIIGVLLITAGNGWAGPQAHPWQVVLGIGMGCAVTAMPVLILLLGKLEILRKPLGQRLLRYASLDDIAIWSVLALILVDWERFGRQAAFLVALAPVTLAVRWLMVRVPEGDRWYLALVWMAACAFASDWAGMHYMVGAFIAGAVVEARWFDQARMDCFRDNILLALMPVYFLSAGLRTTWGAGGMSVIGVAALLLVASVGGKLIGVWLAGRILKWEKGEAGIIGWMLQTKGLVMVVFANVLLDKQIISSETFTALLLMAVGSTMMTIPFVTPRLVRHKELIEKTG